MSALRLTDLSPDPRFRQHPTLQIEIPAGGVARVHLLAVTWEQEQRLRHDLRSRDLLSDVLAALGQLADLLADEDGAA
jgi:hypothetical protein